MNHAPHPWLECTTWTVGHETSTRAIRRQQVGGARARRYRAVALPLVLAAGVQMIATSAWAHEAAAVLGVAQLADEPSLCDVAQGATLPSVVRTSIGFVHARPDGSYAFGCPAEYGGNPSPLTTASGSGDLLGVVSSSVLHISADDGCSFTQMDPPRSGWFAYEIASAAHGVWVLARDGEVSELHHAASAGMTLTRTWSRSADAEDGFTPDAVHEARSADGSIVLVVSGARPSPAIWIARGPSLDALTWETYPTPSGVEGLQRLSVRWVDSGDGGFWVQATLPGGRELWYGAVDAHGDLMWSTGGPAGTSVHGPVPWADGWLATFDGVAHVLSAAELAEASGLPQGALPWAESAPVSWTCLTAMQHRVFACRQSALYELVPQHTEGGSSSGLASWDQRVVFRTSQIGPPDARCGRDDQRAQACLNDWVHFGGENRFLDREAETCPDGQRRDADQDDGAHGDAGGTNDDADVMDASLRDTGNEERAPDSHTPESGASGGGCSVHAHGGPMWPGFFVCLFLRRARRRALFASRASDAPDMQKNGASASWFRRRVAFVQRDGSVGSPVWFDSSGCHRQREGMVPARCAGGASHARGPDRTEVGSRGPNFSRQSRGFFEL